MDIPEPVKKYWPYMLGGVIGLYAIMRISGGSSNSGMSGADAAYAAFMASQTQAGQQQMAAAAQSQQTAAARDVALATLDSQNLQSNNASQSAFLAAQADLASSVGQSAAGIIAALNQPAITAINNSTSVNEAALKSAADAATSAYLAQAHMVQSASAVSADVARATASSYYAIPSAINANTAFQVAESAANERMYASASGAQAARTGAILSTVGTVAGAVVGGPIGAGIGAAIGGAAGGGGGTQVQQNAYMGSSKSGLMWA